MLESIIEKTSPRDAVIILIAAVAAVSFWRGIWGLMDTYLFPDNYTLSLIISLIISLMILFSISFYKGKQTKN
jgi:hypothetical protein